MTNNPYFAKDPTSRPEAEAYDPADFLGVGSIFPPQQARPSMLSELKVLEIGKGNANRELQVIASVSQAESLSLAIAALVVTLELLRQHRDYNRGAKNWAKEVVLLTHSEAKLKQGGWQDVLQMLVDDNITLRIIGVGYDPRPDEEIPQEEFKALPKSERFWRAFCKNLYDQMDPEDYAHHPALGTIAVALSVARAPRSDVTKSTLIKSHFRIGDKKINDDEGIEFPIRYSKATSLARPMSLKRVIASQVAKTRPMAALSGGASQIGGSQSDRAPPAVATLMGTGIEADVTPFQKYVIFRKEDGGGDDGELVEEEVEKENLTKAYKFGSTWVPIDEEDFEQMLTTAGVEVLGFFKESLVQRHQEMGEVYYIWPDPDSISSQVQLSALVQAMLDKEAVAITRWVARDNSPPKVGLAKASIDADGVEHLYWVQLPFAEDERNFLFPSLSKLVNRKGQEVEEHPRLPNDEQMALMDRYVGEMDLDAFAEDGLPWLDPQACFNPAIHRIKEAVYHLATTSDLNTDPVPPPHAELTKFLEPPSELAQKTESTVAKLKRSLDIKLAPPKKKRVDRKAAQTVEGDDEDIDIDAFFEAKKDTPAAGAASSSKKSKPKSGRVISNESPLDDFREITSGGGEIVSKAMQDLGEIVLENLATSFSRSGFPLALECLQEYRQQAMELEEEELYNRWVSPRTGPGSTQLLISLLLQLL